MTLPREFRNRIASHNRHAITAAVLCLLGSWLSWTLAYAFVVGVALGFLSAVHGDEIAAGTLLLGFPVWVHPVAIVSAGLLLLWGAIDQRYRRFHPVSDRPIVGWHILGDVLLTPARLTFGIWDHLGAVILLSETEKGDAFELLRHIQKERKCSRSSLGSLFEDAGLLRRLLDALQLAGWIDLLRHDEEWCYIVPGTEEEAVANLMNEEEEKRDDSSSI